MNTRLAPAHPPRAAPFNQQLAAACLLGVLCAAPALAAASLSSADEFNAGLARIAKELLADKLACSQLAGNAHAVCREQARGKEAVAKAELDLAHTGTRKSQDRLDTVRLDTAYDVARTQCNEKAGGAKTDCTKQAQAARTQGQSDLRMNQRISDARRDASEDRRETDYKLAAEKCGAMVVDARAGCLAAAKAKAGKT